MKKNYLNLIGTFLLTAFFFTGCQKETIEKETTRFKGEIDEQSSVAKSENGGGCRLTMYHYYDALADYHQVDYFTYKNGLVDEWLSSYGSLFKMEYDDKGKLIISRMYDGETLVSTIHFIYEKNKVVKEIWYDGNTQQVLDEVYNTYNKKGELIRNESINFDLYAINTYTNRGDLESWQLFIGGLANAKGEYTYSDEFKNPYSAIPGIQYSFPYANAAFPSGNWWYSSEKITVYDPDGNPFVYYNQDPLQTVWQSGPQLYPLQANYVDKISGGAMTNTFEYENCPGDQNTNSRAKSLRHKSIINSKRIPANLRSSIPGPRRGVIK